MSQKSKLRRRQRNERANGRTDDDDPQPARHYDDAAEYFEQMRIRWEKSQKEKDHG